MQEKLQKEIKYNLVAENTQSTVVAEYRKSADRVEDRSSYQSEAELERAFIKQLETQAYEYLKITSEDELVLNLRQQLEKLNNLTFSDTEWERFFTSVIANPNQSIEEKTATIQEDSTKILDRDDGTIKNIDLIDKKIFTIIVCRLSISMRLETDSAPIAMM